MKSISLFLLFIIYSVILLVLGSNLDFNFISLNKQTENNLVELKSDHDCIMIDRICVFYRYKHDEKFKLKVSLQPGKKYLPAFLHPNYDAMVNIYKHIPRSQSQLDKFNELMYDMKIEYEKNDIIKKISPNKSNEINFIFKDHHGFILHKVKISMDMNKNYVIGPNGKDIAYQFEITDELTDKIYAKIDHTKNEIAWTEAFTKEIDFIEDRYDN